MSDHEQLDYFDEAGNQLGTKSRQQVHADGDWHWLVFVWCAWLDADGRSQLLLQQRARPGDPFIDSLDALAGGHVQADEGHRLAAARELKEEAGLQCEPDALTYLGCEPLVNPRGPCQRVVQHFYLYHDPVDIMQLGFNPEVNGFVSTSLDEVTGLLGPEPGSTTVQGRARFNEDPERQVEMAITPQAFASYPAPILEVFSKSFAAIRTYLLERRVDFGIWSSPADSH